MCIYRYCTFHPCMEKVESTKCRQVQQGKKERGVFAFCEDSETLPERASLDMIRKKDYFYAYCAKHQTHGRSYTDQIKKEGGNLWVCDFGRAGGWSQIRAPYQNFDEWGNCEAAFTSKKGVISHIQDKHCSECTDFFPNYRARDEHQLKAHNMKLPKGGESNITTAKEIIRPKPKARSVVQSAEQDTQGFIQKESALQRGAQIAPLYAEPDPAPRLRPMSAYQAHGMVPGMEDPEDPGAEYYDSEDDVIKRQKGKKRIRPDAELESSASPQGQQKSKKTRAAVTTEGPTLVPTPSPQGSQTSQTSQPRAQPQKGDFPLGDMRNLSLSPSATPPPAKPAKTARKGRS